MAATAYKNVWASDEKGETAHVEVDTEGKVTLTAVSLEEAMAILCQTAEDLPKR